MKEVRIEAGVYKPERTDGPGRRGEGGGAGLTRELVVGKLMFVRSFWSITVTLNF